MKIVCLMENTTRCGNMAAEHGLSLYLETGRHRILFDMGPDGLFAENARKLGVDLKNVDTAVLSHGHYDHGGGLSVFLQINDHALVYADARVFGTFRNRTGKYIGLDPRLKENPRFILCDSDVRVDEGIRICSCDDEVRRYPTDSYGLTVEQDGALAPDRFLHEQYLIAEEGNKRIVISGCSHKGILNIVSWLKPDVLVGGFHLKDEKRPEVLDRTAEMLKQSGALFYTCHCTGEEQYSRMKKRMGDSLYYLHCGDAITITP